MLGKPPASSGIKSGMPVASAVLPVRNSGAWSRLLLLPLLLQQAGPCLDVNESREIPHSLQFTCHVFVQSGALRASWALAVCSRWGWLSVCSRWGLHFHTWKCKWKCITTFPFGCERSWTVQCQPLKLRSNREERHAHNMTAAIQQGFANWVGDAIGVLLAALLNWPGCSDGVINLRATAATCNVLGATLHSATALHTLCTKIYITRHAIHFITAHASTTTQLMAKSLSRRLLKALNP